MTVAITGTTVIFEGSRGGRNKLYNLEGSSRVALKKKPSDWRKVLAGQMLDVPPGATTLPMPVNFDINQLMRTHPLAASLQVQIGFGLPAQRGREIAGKDLPLRSVIQLDDMAFRMRVYLHSTPNSR